MTTSAISTAGLTKHYPGVPALTDLTLDVPAGSIYGFLGPNGAGKSTTLKILGGLIRPTAGSASVAGISTARRGWACCITRASASSTVSINA